MINALLPSFKVVLDDRVIKTNEMYPLKLRVTYKRASRYYSINEDLKKQDWPLMHSDQAPAKLRKLRNRIGEIEYNAVNCAKDIQDFSFKKFVAAYFGEKEQENTLLIQDTFEKHIKMLEENGQIGTAISYRTALNSLLKFNPNLKLIDITPEFLKAYERSMVSLGKSTTTVGFYTRSLRTIINMLISEGKFLKENYPFGTRKFKIPAGKKAKKALSGEEVTKILRYKCNEYDTDWKRRAIDFWIFSFYSNGINFKDIALLRWKNVHHDFFNYVRQKTALTTKEDSITIRVPLNEITERIIFRWSKSSQFKRPQSYVFDILEDNDDILKNPTVIDRKIENFIKVSNKWLKRIGEELELSIPLTTYVARHSYATLLITRGGGSIELVRQNFGHTNIKTTQQYLGGFGLEDQKKYAEALLQLA